LRTKYIVEFLRCKFKSGKPGGYDWKKPVKSFGRNEAVFWRKKGEPTGKLTMTKIGPHDMIQEVKLKSPDPLESPDLPFKLCHVNVRVAAHVKYETGESHGMKEFKWVAVGKFNGNKFTGKISHKGGREKSKETVTGTVTVLLGPRNKEVKCGKISSKIANFTATYNRKTVNLDTVEETGPYTTDTTVTLSGSNIPVNEKSPLLTTKIPPLDRIARLPRLQMQYRWAALAYTVSGEAAGKVKVTFKQNRKTNKWSENRRLVSVKPSPNAYVSVYFTFQ